MTTEHYRPVRKVAARVIDGKAVMITLADSRLHRLNASATRVWQAIEAGQSVPEIVDALCEAYAVPRARAHEDVDVLLGELVALGIVVPEEPAMAEAPQR